MNGSLARFLSSEAIIPNSKLRMALWRCSLLARRYFDLKTTNISSARFRSGKAIISKSKLRTSMSLWGSFRSSDAKYSNVSFAQFFYWRGKILNRLVISIDVFKS